VLTGQAKKILGFEISRAVDGDCKATNSGVVTKRNAQFSQMTLQRTCRRHHAAGLDTLY